MTLNKWQLSVLRYLDTNGGALTKTALTRHIQRIPAADRAAAMRGLIRRGLVEEFEQMRLGPGPSSVAYRLTESGQDQVQALIEDGIFVRPAQQRAAQ